jgi:hypothetical protein
MTCKKLEIISIGGAVPNFAYFPSLLSSVVLSFHLSAKGWERSFTAVKFLGVFLIGVSVGAAFVEKS